MAAEKRILGHHPNNQILEKLGSVNVSTLSASPILSSLIFLCWNAFYHEFLKIQFPEPQTTLIEDTNYLRYIGTSYAIWAQTIDISHVL